MADAAIRAGRVPIAISVGLALFAGAVGAYGAVIALRDGNPWQPALLTAALAIAAVLQLWKGWTGFLVFIWGGCAALAAILLLDPEANFTFAMAAVPIAGFVSGAAGWWQRRRAEAAALQSLSANFE